MEGNSVHLTVNEIHTYLGKGHVLNGVSLDVGKGEIVAFLGRNGVGKSTTLKSIVGLTPIRRGAIRLNGEEIARLKPYQVCRKGLGYVPEERRIFPHLTVRENLLLGIKPKQKANDPWTIEKDLCVFSPSQG